MLTVLLLLMIFTLFCIFIDSIYIYNLKSKNIYFSSQKQYPYNLSNREDCKSKTLTISNTLKKCVQCITSIINSQMQLFIFVKPQGRHHYTSQQQQCINEAYNNYNSKPMKRKHRQYLFELTNSRDQTRQPEEYLINRPLKSPSPDRKSSNIIACTSSPQIRDFKKQITPIRTEPTASRILDKIEQREKQVKHGTTPKHDKEMAEAIQSFKNEETMVSSKKRNIDERSIQTSKSHHRNYSSYQHAFNAKNGIVAQYSPEDFLAQSNRRSDRSKTTSELDYAKMLRQKQETIKQLRELIEMINRNSESMSDNSFNDSSKVEMLQKKLKEYKSQVKIFQIQNQKLISVIQNNHVNINSNKEEILQREIRELRETLADKEREIKDIIQENQNKLGLTEIRARELERENDKLMKLMRNKDTNDKQEMSMVGSVQSLPSKYNNERVTLSKIREQYHQNLKLSRENFDKELQLTSERYDNVFQKLNIKLDTMTKQMVLLEQKQANIAHIIQDKSKKREADRDHHPQIESLLLQKYSHYEKQLSEEKRNNENLAMELSRAQKNIEELQMKSFNYSQQFSIRSHHQQQMVEKLTKQNSFLASRLKQLQDQNRKLTTRIDQIQKQQDIQNHQAEQKMLTFIQIYEAKLKEEKDSYERIIQSLNIKIDESRANELRNRQELADEKNDIEKKLQTLVAYYDKEINGYRTILELKVTDHKRSVEQNEQIKHEMTRINSLKTCQSQEFKMLTEEYDFVKRKCSDLQRNRQYFDQEVNKLIAQMKDSQRQRTMLAKEKEQLQQELQRMSSQTLSNRKIQRQNQELRSHLQHVNIENGQFSQKLDQLTKQLRDSQTKITMLQQQLQRREQLIDQIKQELIKQEQELHELRGFYSSFKKDRSTFNYQTLEEDLKELKKIINFEYGDGAVKLQGDMMEKYFTLESDYQLKIQQNMKLQEEILFGKQEVYKEQREKARLAEKIANLQKNIAIYEQELKERKGLYEQLLREKTRIQKQTVLFRKIRVSQQQHSGVELVPSQIGTRIDRLLILQRKRNDSLKRLFEKEQPFYYSVN